jgi:beta-lactamase regulating signal transducer with metallopeptidase domain
MPLGASHRLPPEQVEAFLIHELAHVRCGDYLVNLAQGLVEGLFFHPGVWWISKVIRVGRENCCDDTVVALTADPRGLAVGLTLLEEHR